MEDKKPTRGTSLAIIGNGDSIARMTREIAALNDFYRARYNNCEEDIFVISSVQVKDDPADKGLPFVHIPVHVDTQLDLERFAALGKAIEPVVISFHHMAATAEQMSAALGGWSIDSVLDISRQLRANKIDFELIKVQQAAEYNHKLSDVAVPTRKKKKRGHNSALDRVICKSAYC